MTGDADLPRSRTDEPAIGKRPTPGSAQAPRRLADQATNSDRLALEPTDPPAGSGYEPRRVTGPPRVAGAEAPVIDAAEPGEGVAPDTADLGRKAVRGGAVTMLGQVAKIALQFLGVVILSRLLTRVEYGLLAMITVVIGVGEIFRDFGLTSAAIQAKTLSKSQRSNLFWINSAVGLLLALGLFFGAPALAMLYDQPDLVFVGRALALVLVFNGLATQHRADLTRRLQFKSLVIIDVAAQTLALAVAIVLAVAHFGLIALVAQQLTQYGVMLVLAWAFGRWLPGRYDRGATMSELLRFGWHLAASQVVNYIGKNVDTVVVGLRMGAAPLGLYNRGYQLLMTPLGQFRAPISNVAIPVLARLQDEPERYRAYLVRGQMLMGLSIGGGLGILIGAATPIVQVFLGREFWDVDWIFRLLGLAGIFQTLAYVGYWVYVSRGLVRQLLHYTWVQTGLRIVFVLGGSWWGVNGVAAGWAVAMGIEWLISFWWLRRTAGINVRVLVSGGGAILGLSVLLGVAAFAGSVVWAQGPAVARLALALAGGTLAYALAAMVSRPLRVELRALAAIARSGLGRGRG